MAEHENKEGVLTQTTPDDEDEATRADGPDPDSVEPASAVNLEAQEERAVSVERAAAGTNGGSQVSAPAPPASQAVVGTAHSDAGHGDHGLAHTTPVWLLGAILAVLMVLTILTVLVTGVDLGAQGNLIVAMVIATIKATLVVAFFMHLVWDKKLHLILFLTSVLFLILFLSVSTTDRSEYQPAIDHFQLSQPAQ